MSFKTEYKYGNDNASNYLKLMYSSNYSGIGDPSSSTWTELAFTKPSSQETQTSSGTIDLSSISGTNVYLAFKYNYTSGNYRRWSIDDISIVENTIIAEPSNHASSFNVVTTSTLQDEITLTWSDNDGAVIADKFLVKASSISYADITNPIDGTNEADAALVKNVAHGTETVTFTGLTTSTTYYFKIFPYTNTGNAIDYKVDDSIPQESETTDTAPTIPDLIISEVADPKDNASARFVELFNGSGNTIDFSSEIFYLCRQANGSSWADIQLTGTLANGAMYVIATSSSNHNSAYGSNPDIENNNISGNGDDGYFLYYEGDHTTGTLVDQYGVLNVDGTGKSWDYQDSRVVRNTSEQKSGAKATHAFDIADWTITDPANAADMTPGTKDGGQTLPIKLLSFTAKYNNNNIELQWQTATETNNDYFTIESSYDAKDFEKISNINGAGNSNSIIDYSFTDNNVNLSKTIYYKLKQTDFDGKYSYSSIISVNSKIESFEIIRTYTNDGIMNIYLNSNTDNAALIELYDIRGSLMFNDKLKIHKGINSYKFDVSNYAMGIYLLRINNANKLINTKLYIK